MIRQEMTEDNTEPSGEEERTPLLGTLKGLCLEVAPKVNL